jgi:DNA-binding transcriptional ArsR family regulator
VSGELKPTLWRTCRALANRRRLGILRHLLAHPDSSVSEVAAACRLRLPAASQYLRALNARGLLAASRSGPTVRYRVEPDPLVPIARPLTDVLRSAIAGTGSDLRAVFRTLTAFTHPRRLSLVSELQKGPATRPQLASRCGMSQEAAGRHLRKLRDRRFVQCCGGRYAAKRPRTRLGRVLWDILRPPAQPNA